jgi:phosphoribosylglycinamide formyltransferase-1
MKKLRLGILGSTRGTDMLALIAAMQQNKLSATIEIVISNRSAAQILTRATDFNLPAQFIDATGLTRDVYDEELTKVLQQYDVELIVLLGYMRILSNQFVATWRNKIINVHPSLLPDFAGGMNNNVHQAVLNAGKTETGCTVHYVTEEVDEGLILVQKRCAVLPTDTVASLKTRVQELEGIALIDAIENINAGRP